MIVVPCTSCGQDLQVRDDLSGHRVRCGLCGGIVVVVPPAGQALPSQPPSPATPGPVLATAIKAEPARALSTQPVTRTASASERNGEPLVPSRGALARWLERPGLVLPLVIGVVAAVIVVLGTGILFLRRAAAERDEALRLAEQAESAAHETAPRAATMGPGKGEDALHQALGTLRADRAERGAYALRIGLAEREMKEGNLGRAAALLDGCRWDLRNFEYDYLRTLLRNHVRTFSAGPFQILRAAFSADGKRLVLGGNARDLSLVTSASGEVRIYDTEDWRELAAVPLGKQSITAFALSPDGQLAATASALPSLPPGVGPPRMGGGPPAVEGTPPVGGPPQRRRMMQLPRELTLWDLRDGHDVLTITTSSGDISAIAFSPDGRRLATVGEAGVLELFDRATGEQLTRTVAHEAPAHAAAFSPDGHYLATAGQDAKVRLWDGLGLPIDTLNGFLGWSVAFSPDSHRLMIGGNGRLIGWELTTRRASVDQRLVASSPAAAVPIRDLTFSLDGKRLVMTGESRDVKVCDAATGREVVDIPVAPSNGDLYPATAVACARDGRILGVVDNQVSIWSESADDGGRVLARHSAVTAMAVSHDGQLLAVAGDDGVIHLRDRKTGRELHALPGPARSVRALAFSPDGRYFVSGGEDRVIRIWALSEERHSWIVLGQHRHPITSVAFSADSRFVVSCANIFPSEVKVWEAGRQVEAVTIPQVNQAVEKALFSPDGRYLAQLGDKPTPRLRIYDLEKQADTVNLLLPASPAGDFAFTPEGNHLLGILKDGSLREWDATTGRPIRAVRARVQGGQDCAFSPDTRRVAVATGVGTARVLDIESGEELVSVETPGGAQLLSFTPDGRQLLAACGDGSIRAWGGLLERGAYVLRAGPPERVFRQITDTCFSPDGSFLATSSGDGTVTLWHVAGGTPIVQLHGHAGPVHGVAISLDGRRVATAGDDSWLKLWDLTTGKELASLSGVQHKAAFCVDFSPDGKQVVAGYEGGVINIWDVETGAHRTLEGHTGAVFAARFGPDGLIVSASHAGDVILWDAATGRKLTSLREPPQPPVSSVAFSRDGRLVAFGDQLGEIRILPISRGPFVSVGTQGRRQCKYPCGMVWSVAFSPDGRFLAAAGDHGFVVLYEVSTGRRVQVFTAPTNLWRLAYGPNGKSFAVSGQDGTVRVWPLQASDADLDRVSRQLLNVEEYVRNCFIQSLLPQSEVLARIREEPSFSEEDRRYALALAAATYTAADPLALNVLRGDIARGLNNASWFVVRTPTVREDDCRQAFRRAEEMMRLQDMQPRDDRTYFTYLNTLGVAQYRAGHLREAIETLTRSDEGNRRLEGHAIPADVAFLAMAHYRLGHREEAAAYFRLLISIPLSRTKNDDTEESTQFIAETKKVMGLSK